jgi:hypothetical protein
MVFIKANYLLIKFISNFHVFTVTLDSVTFN